MHASFLRPALLCNGQSGSHDPEVRAAIEQACIRLGSPLVATFALPDQSLPDAGALRRVDADLLLVWAGDGTINAAYAAVDGWSGALLPLPGGTLNLLSKQLHGDRPAPDIVADALSRPARRRPIPVIRAADREALITIVAGPATHWADVREKMRRDGLMAAGREAAEALDDMLSATGVRLAGQSENYPAIILTPTETGLVADGISHDNALDLLRHGLAWLEGDFRDGPSERIGEGETILIESNAPISLEYDGERDETPSPARFALGMSRIDFVDTA
ncbi:diacylglycerol/lipid kinase family protein [Sphingopyxis sp. MWB1]|uniref:diacylglycerol/lipid kinase family protein n=1 Tax=Sphingopyxis sp. MWB1 TaxID=1537715 RepID=UPI00051A8B7A|nr:diacylglycerol kinase family protein [Sphingopyxis sp. MWB1]